MLIVALVMALVTAVVTSNQIIAWVCIAASVIGVVLLIVDALRERRQRDTTPADEFDAEYPEDKEDETEAVDEDVETPAETPEKTD
jgi:ABC-type uncharacterized transport system permease subunit